MVSQRREIEKPCNPRCINNYLITKEKDILLCLVEMEHHILCLNTFQTLFEYCCHQFIYRGQHMFKSFIWFTRKIHSRVIPFDTTMYYLFKKQCNEFTLRMFTLAFYLAVNKLIIGSRQNIFI